MHFTLQQLKLFEAVARHGSYTRAAETLHLTQPAVSIQIKRLESQVGLQLLEKVGKKVLLTSAGRKVLQASESILDQVDWLKDSIDEINGSVSGPLQVAVVTTAKYFMPHLLGSFLQHHPTVVPSLKFTNRARVVERLFNNEDDFVVMGQIPEDEQLISYPFLNNVLGMIAPVDHPLAGKRNIPIKRLLEERVLMREPGSGTRSVFEQTLNHHGLPAVEPYMELGSSEAIKQGVMAGLGIAVVSHHSIQLELESGKLTLLDVDQFPLVRRWYAVHRKGTKLSLVAQTFLNYILEEGEQLLKLEY